MSFPRQHDVPGPFHQILRIETDKSRRTAGSFVKPELFNCARTAKRSDGAAHVQPEGEGTAGFSGWRRPIVAPRSAETWIWRGAHRTISLLGSPHGCRDFAPRTVASVQQIHGTEPRQGFAVGSEPPRLPHHGLFPLQAEPGKVIKDCVFELRPRTAGIDILDSEEESSFLGDRVAKRENR